jgi:phosphoglycolate phosphatase-like HAD superfamily hydrolase
MNKPTVLLFDVDGTLVTTGGVGRRALELAFERSFGRKDACAHFRFDGMTDRAIVRLGLRAIGQREEAEQIDAVLDVYLGVLAEEVERAAHDRYRVHSGMVEALDVASHRKNVAVGLGTGNVREGARLKLERVRLFHRFAFGGYGCDAEDRAELLRCGARRGAERLGVPVDECRVVIVGDTPKDVAAALALGAECVGVGTGSFTPAQLLEAGATAAFANLASDGALAALFPGD